MRSLPPPPPQLSGRHLSLKVCFTHWLFFVDGLSRVRYCLVLCKRRASLNHVFMCMSSLRRDGIHEDGRCKRCWPLLGILSSGKSQVYLILLAPFSIRGCKLSFFFLPPGMDKRANGSLFEATGKSSTAVLDQFSSSTDVLTPNCPSAFVLIIRKNLAINDSWIAPKFRKN